jgi:hypothetical protein
VAPCRDRGPDAVDLGVVGYEELLVVLARHGHDVLAREEIGALAVLERTADALRVLGVRRLLRVRRRARTALAGRVGIGAVLARVTPALVREASTRSAVAGMRGRIAA